LPGKKVWNHWHRDCLAKKNGGEDAEFRRMLRGSSDIIAEWVNEDQQARAKMRDLFANHGTFRSRVVPEKETEGIKYRDYFDLEELYTALTQNPCHETGWKVKSSPAQVVPPEEEALAPLENLFKGERGSFAGSQDDCSRQLQRLLLLRWRQRSG
jgi:uncharacterized protein